MPDDNRSMDRRRRAAAVAADLFELHDGHSSIGIGHLAGGESPRWAQVAVGAAVREDDVPVALNAVRAVKAVHIVDVVVRAHGDRGTEHYTGGCRVIAVAAAAAAIAAEATGVEATRVVARAETLAASTRAEERAQAASEVGAQQTVDEEVTAGLQVETGGCELLEERQPLGRSGGRLVVGPKRLRNGDPQAEQIEHEEWRFGQNEENNREKRQERSAFEERRALPVPPAYCVHTRGLHPHRRVRCRRRRRALARQ